jgi:hypothetical protein
MKLLKNYHVQMLLFVLIASLALATGMANAQDMAMAGFIGATLANGYPTLLDAAKSLDPDGKTATVVELLNQTNEILLDLPWVEGNLPTGHRTTVRTGLPTATWRQLYAGVDPSKSNRAQVDDTCGMLEARAEVDKDVADLNGNTSQFRLSEAQAFIEAMNESMASTLFYGDVATNPERFTGLAARYNSTTAANGQNVLSAGGAGSDNTSVWLAVLGPNTLHGIFPKGSKAGLQHEDLGLIDAFDSNNKRFRAYGDHWQWKTGISLRDWRYAVRICNIDVSDMAGVTGTQALTAATNIIKMLIMAKHRIPSMGMGRAVIYCNRTVRQYLDIMAMDKSTSALAIREAAGQFETSFLGIPIRTCDQILNTETVVA